MPDLNILEDKELEIKAKYLLVFLHLLFYSNKEEKQIEGNAEEMSHALGISLNMFYRARSVLVKRGIINLSNRFCSSTGKKINDLYELN